MPEENVEDFVRRGYARFNRAERVPLMSKSSRHWMSGIRMACT